MSLDTSVAIASTLVPPPAPPLTDTPSVTNGASRRTVRPADNAERYPSRPLRVLSLTNMYPTPEWPAFGTFVFNEVQSLKAAGVDVDVLLINGREHTWNYLLGLLPYWRALLRGHYDVVHAHYVFTGVIARAQWGVPVVLTHHGPEVIGHPRWQTWLAKLVTPFFDEVIYRTREMRSALHDRDGWVIPAGIDLERFVPIDRAEARAALGLPQHRPLVLWAGEYWRPEKRIELAERAMEQVKATLPDAELVVLSKKPQDVVPVYMSACDALVLTSSHEGSPNVVKEAMACNLPIVSVRVGDVAEIVAGTDACAIAERDPSDIARKLVEVLRPSRRSNGRQRVGWLAHERVTAEIIRVYRSAVAGRRVRHASR